jgi:catechol 2,3-dioxygenase-like lactoylglutathione lyase family enzyme
MRMVVFPSLYVPLVSWRGGVMRKWKVLGIRWVGASAGDFLALRTFVVDVLGLQVRHEEDDFLVADAENGDRFEVFGPRAPRPDRQFDRSPVMAGFLVDNIEAARETLAGAEGTELLGALQGDDRYKWQHFRAPDGIAFELTWDARVGTT